MNTEEEAREALANQRQKEAHIQETITSRLAEELETPSDLEIQEEAREAMVEQRRHADHVQQAMLRRAAAEVGLPPSTDPPA